MGGYGYCAIKLVEIFQDSLLGEKAMI